jgi:hypothetical protein
MTFPVSVGAFDKGDVSTTKWIMRGCGMVWLSLVMTMTLPTVSLFNAINFLLKSALQDKASSHATFCRLVYQFFALQRFSTECTTEEQSTCTTEAHNVCRSILCFVYQ